MKDKILSLLKSKDKESQALGIELWNTFNLNLMDFFEPIIDVYRYAKLSERFSGDNSSIIYDLLEVYNCNNLPLYDLGLTYLDKCILNIPSQNIIKISLWSNKLSDLPTWLTIFSNLEYISLERNNFEKVPDVLFKLKKLKYLDLDYSLYDHESVYNLRMNSPNLKINFYNRK